MEHNFALFFRNVISNCEFLELFEEKTVLQALVTNGLIYTPSEKYFIT